MEIIINDNNLNNNEIQEFSTKVRAILFNDRNQILIANYADVILLPGGKVEDGEAISMAIIRELSEELGQKYNDDELEFFATINYYQKNYPKTDGTYKNRLVQTHYFIGNYKEIFEEQQMLTEKEKNAGFALQLVSFKDLKNILLSNETKNPRNIYFQQELLIILNCISKINSKIKMKTIRKQSK